MRVKSITVEHYAPKLELPGSWMKSKLRPRTYENERKIHGWTGRVYGSLCLCCINRVFRLIFPPNLIANFFLCHLNSTTFRDSYGVPRTRPLGDPFAARRIASCQRYPTCNRYSLFSGLSKAHDDEVNYCVRCISSVKLVLYFTGSMEGQAQIRNYLTSAALIANYRTNAALLANLLNYSKTMIVFRLTDLKGQCHDKRDFFAKKNKMALALHFQDSARDWTKLLSHNSW